MKIAGSDTKASNKLKVDVQPDKLKALKVYVTVNYKNLSSSRSDIQFAIKDIAGDENTSYDAIFDGPNK